MPITPITLSKKKSKKVALAVRERLTAYMLGAFALVTGLAWDDAIRSFIQVVYPLPKESVQAKVIYASILTIIVVLITILFARLTRKKEERE